MWREVVVDIESSSTLSKRKRISIIILNYNGKRFLKKLFKTLAEQTYKNFEVIFVDNASTDHSVEVLKGLLNGELSKVVNTKIVLNRENLGYCKGNNSGLKHASGEYIVFLNNDTYLSPTWLETLVDAMDSHPCIGACQSRLISASDCGIQCDGFFLDIYGWAQGMIIVGSKSDITNIPFYLCGASMILRRSALEKAGPFDPQLFSGDCDLCWRLRLYGYGLATALKSKCYHYVSMTRKTVVSSVEETLYRHREIVRVLLKNYSAKNIVIRLPRSIMLMFVEAMWLSLRYKTPLHLASFLKAMAWNLRILSDTLVVRSQVQKNRKVSDREIEKRMPRYSVLLTRTWGVKINATKN